MLLAVARTSSPYQVPDFDVSQLVKNEKKQEQPKESTPAPPDIEQQIFTRGLGQAPNRE